MLDNRMLAALPYLREWRLHRKLTQAQLSERTGISAAGISQLELGIRRARWGNIKKLAKALRVSAEQLVEEQPPERRKQQPNSAA